MAQDTLRGLNPSVIVELSATPTDDSNVLVDIKGLELKREEMIKLDLHIQQQGKHALAKHDAGEQSQT